MVAVVHRGFLSSRFDRDASKKKRRNKATTASCYKSKKYFYSPSSFSRNPFQRENDARRCTRTINTIDVSSSPNHALVPHWFTNWPDNRVILNAYIAYIRIVGMIHLAAECRENQEWNSSIVSRAASGWTLGLCPASLMGWCTMGGKKAGND